MEKEEARRRIAELREVIRDNSRRYYVDNAPVISDYDYDHLMYELEDLEKAQGKEPLRKDLQGPLVPQAGKRSSQEVTQASLLQGTTGLSVPGRSGCQSV